MQENPRFVADILKRGGSLSPERIDAAVAAIEREGKDQRLATVLVNQGIADERTIAQCLADAFGFPVMLDIRLEQLPLEPLRALGFDLAWARKSRVVPVDVTADVVTVAVADPLDTSAIDDLRPLLGRGIEAVVSTPTAIAQALNHLSTRIGGASGLVGEGEREAEARPELELEDEAQVIRWVSSLFLEAIDDRATDIHIQPEETEVVVRHRVDGELQRVRTAPLGFLPSIAARIKVIAGLDLAEKRLPQDGRIGFKVAGKNIDVRVSTIPVGQGAGERLVLRILDQSNISLSLTDLGFTSDRLARMRELVQRPHGIVLVTGPTGSGKTTTLYACLNQINRPNVNILTTEDPIEYRLRGVSQMQVNPKIGLDFASCLRAFLRQDPDVIMVGEIRDRETASVAVQASLTGHLVLSTVHTNDAAGATARLGEMGVESFHIASTLQGVLAQRLVRVLCHACKRPAGAQYEPVGCAACKGTGYRGRTGIHELLPVSEKIRALILKNADAGAIRRAAAEEGMITLRDDGLRKVREGETSMDEVLAATADALEG